MLQFGGSYVKNRLRIGFTNELRVMPVLKTCPKFPTGFPKGFSGRFPTEFPAEFLTVFSTLFSELDAE